MPHIIYGLSRAMAWFGGLVLTLIALVSVASIAGRALSGFGLGPVPGDFELVEAGTALAVFCFLPWAHLKRGHAWVDLFWPYYPAPMKKLLEVLADTLMLACWVVLVWRMGVGMMDYRENAEVSFILQMPVWWGYAASFPFAVAGVVVYAWRLVEDFGLAEPPYEMGPAGGEH
jgi:TRAP-type C4-dicarboxylate transport system permease small subunit